MRCIDPEEVVQVTDDLAQLGEVEVRSAFAREGFLAPGDLDYVLTHLAEAKAFMSDLAGRGEGLLYLIG